MTEDEYDAAEAEKAIAEAEEKGTISLAQMQAKYCEPQCSTTNTGEECENCKFLKERIAWLEDALEAMRGMLGESAWNK